MPRSKLVAICSSSAPNASGEFTFASRRMKSRTAPTSSSPLWKQRLIYLIYMSRSGARSCVPAKVALSVSRRWAGSAQVEEDTQHTDQGCRLRLQRARHDGASRPYTRIDGLGLLPALDGSRSLRSTPRARPSKRLQSNRRPASRCRSAPPATLFSSFAARVGLRCPSERNPFGRELYRGSEGGASATPRRRSISTGTQGNTRSCASFWATRRSGQLLPITPAPKPPVVRVSKPERYWASAMANIGRRATDGPHLPTALRLAGARSRGVGRRASSGRASL